MTPENTTPAFIDLRPAPIERLAFNLKETAATLGISEVSVWRLEKRGLLRPSRALRHPLWARSEIERFLADTQAKEGK
jgi:predicted DNA-binding transcriptional regulator AlpA